MVFQVVSTGSESNCAKEQKDKHISASVKADNFIMVVKFGAKLWDCDFKTHKTIIKLKL